MSDTTEPKVESVICGYCDTEAVRGQFYRLECPDCGRVIEVKANYAARSERDREKTIERHSGGNDE